MMKLRTLMTMIIFLTASHLAAFESKNLSLRGGLSLSYNNAEALQDSSDSFIGFGFNSQFAYRKDWWEVSMASFTQFGSLDPVIVSTSGQPVREGGSYLDFALAPLFKHHVDWQPRENWGFYYGIGPMWSLQTIRLENNVPDAKITYQSFGAQFVTGIEEIKINENAHPIYVELSVSWRSSDKVALVDVTDFSEVITLSEASVGQDFTQTTVMINIGITLF